MSSSVPSGPAQAGGSAPAVALDPRNDAALVGKVFRASGRVHIGGAFDSACARRLHECLLREIPWQYVAGDDLGHVDLGPSLEAMADPTRERLAAVAGRAAAGFAYRYRNFPILDHYQAGQFRELYVMRFLEFLNSAPFLDWARRVTGVQSIAYADAQATLYGPGDFLTTHDDAVAGKERHAAYVLSLTPAWRVDWGGLLAFPDAHGHVHEAFSPAWNALNLLRVPSAHLVTQVASFAPANRYSITGWLRG